MMLRIMKFETFFDSKLLNFLMKKKNDEVRRIFEEYKPSDESLTAISRLSDSSLATLLHYAAEYGNEEIAKYLIDSGSEVDARGDQGRTPLMLAVAQKREMAIDVLLNAKADIHVIDFRGKSALQMILECRPISLRTMTTLFKIKVDFAKNLQEAGFTLRQAIADGNMELMKFLLGQGRFAVNALHTAVGMNDLEMVRLLVDEYGADVDGLDITKSTPIRYLCCYGTNYVSGESLEILKILLSRAKSLTTCDFFGKMQVRDLLVFGCREAVELVLQRIDDWNVTDKRGNTVVHYMAENCNADLIETLNNRDFDVNAHNVSGLTPWHCAARQLLPRVVEFFLQRGADVRTRFHFSESPLRVLFVHIHSQSRFQNARKCVQLLLEYGLDPVDEHLGEAFEVARRIHDSVAIGRNTELGNTLVVMEPILAHLAVRKGRGNDIDECAMSKIFLQSSWMEYFEMCEKEIDRMKKTAICGHVTLFKFLTENEEKITAYVRNVDLVSELEKLLEDFKGNSPYSNLLQKRLAEATQLAELKQKAIAAI